MSSPSANSLSMLSSSPTIGPVMGMRSGGRCPRARSNSVDLEGLLDPTTLLEVASMSGDEGVNLHSTACSVFNFLMADEGKQ